jgi:glycerophosphoryl diester phosphodiesterase
MTHEPWVHASWYRRVMRPVRALGVAIAVAGCGDPEPPPGECPANAVVNVGHRGTGTNTPDNPFPENTLAAFAQAAIEGAQMIELDVTHSADGVLMVIHDRTVDRTTDGTGCVGDLTAAELKLLDAAAGTPLEGTGVTIPTLGEVLAATDLDVNVEIKVHTGTCAATDRDQAAADVVAAIADDPRGRRFVVSSFDEDVLTAVRDLEPTIYLSLLTLIPGDATVAEARGFDALAVLSLNVRDRDDAEAIRAHGLDVIVWTENGATAIDTHLTSGVDMIITDEPDVVETVRAGWCDRNGY